MANGGDQMQGYGSISQQDVEETLDSTPNATNLLESTSLQLRQMELCTAMQSPHQ